MKIKIKFTFENGKIIEKIVDEDNISEEVKLTIEQEMIIPNAIAIIT